MGDNAEYVIEGVEDHAAEKRHDKQHKYLLEELHKSKRVTDSCPKQELHLLNEAVLKGFQIPEVPVL